MAFYSIASLLFFFFLLLISCAAGARNHGAPSNLLRSSCLQARYPTICTRTLSTYPGPARTPADLARAAVSISYGRARKASAYLARLRARKDGGATTWATALGDCLDQLSDATAELGDTMRELRALRARNTGEFRWHMSNAETWVSAALTDQDTCLDGIGQAGRRGGASSGVGSDVRRRIKNVAKVTSNALYLINRLG
ncbi:hypothetical protein V2J09_012412 [Rumex salicifolius]